jgi:TPR repeat protein
MEIYSLEKEAEKGNIKSQKEIAFYYLKNQKDLSKSIYWLKKLSDEGHPNSQYNLGVCYYHGEGIDKNLSIAALLFEKSANLGHINAQYNLGICYKNGEGFYKDMKKAFYW